MKTSYHYHHLPMITGAILLLLAACADEGGGAAVDASINASDTSINPNAPPPASGLTITAGSKASISMTWIPPEMQRWAPTSPMVLAPI